MRKVSQQRKFKKYNNLKHKPKSTNQTRVQEEQENLPLEKTGKTLYSDILTLSRQKPISDRNQSIDFRHERVKTQAKQNRNWKKVKWDKNINNNPT